MVGLKLISVIRRKASVRLVNTIAAEDGVNVPFQKVVAEFMRHAEVLESRIVNVGGVGDAKVVADAQ